MTRQCAWCKRIWDADEWKEQRYSTEVIRHITHTICDECKEEVEKATHEFKKQKRRKDEL